MRRCFRFLDEVDQNIVARAVGNDDMDAGTLYVAGSMIFIHKYGLGIKD